MEAVCSVGNSQSLLEIVSKFCLERRITFDLNGFEEKKFDSEFSQILFGQNAESNSNCKVGNAKKRQIEALSDNKLAPLQLAQPLFGESCQFDRGEKGIKLQPCSGDQGFFEVKPCQHYTSVSACITPTRSCITMRSIFHVPVPDNSSAPFPVTVPPIPVPVFVPVSVTVPVHVPFSVPVSVTVHVSVTKLP